jgi:hypothetical protein
MGGQFLDWCRAHAGQILLGATVLTALSYFFGQTGCGTVSYSDFALPPGITVASEPRQVTVSGERSWSYKGATITPLARYDISARVVIAVGNSLDTVGRIGPIDATVVWGTMSDTTVLQQFRFLHVGRFVSWDSDTPPLPWPVINTQIANMHLIPSNDRVAAKVLALRTDDIVRMTGFLVSVHAADGSWSWSSSTSREDTGDGACEIMWVESIY